MNPEGTPLPSQAPMSEDVAALKEEVLRLTRQINLERQAASQKLTSSEARCKAEMDKLRQATHQHGRDLENQNQALLQSLGRMKAENDELQKKVMTLEIQASQMNFPRVVAEPTPTVPILSSQPALMGGAIPPKQP